MGIYISFFILASYIMAVCVRWGVPKSVSSTFFTIRHKWIFSAVMAASALLLIHPLIGIVGEMFEWLGFLTCSGCLLVAFAPNLDDKMEEQVHMTGAIIMGVASQAIVSILNPWMLLLWSVWFPFASGESRVFWAEMVGCAILYITIIV